MRSECDYDTSPTALYQAIEARQWHEIPDILNDEENQAAIWVVRKELSGRLRWRLLPLHAAIIFQAPGNVIECLLEEYPAGAAAKDDQGMLPLHLALRNQPIHWSTVEDLLTAHPAAVFSKDRKGRTPLQGGLAAAAAASMRHNHHQTRSIASPTNNNSPRPPPPLHNNDDDDDHDDDDNSQHNKPYKAALSVLDLYTSIVVAGERTQWKQQHHPQPTALLAHAERLQELRVAFDQEQALRQEQHAQEIRTLQKQLLSARAAATTTRYSAASDKNNNKNNSFLLQQENQALRRLTRQLLSQQEMWLESIQQTNLVEHEDVLNLAREQQDKRTQVLQSWQNQYQLIKNDLTTTGLFKLSLSTEQEEEEEVVEEKAVEVKVEASTPEPEITLRSSEVEVEEVEESSKDTPEPEITLRSSKVEEETSKDTPEPEITLRSSDSSSGEEKKMEEALSLPPCITPTPEEMASWIKLTPEEMAKRITPTPEEMATRIKLTPEEMATRVLHQKTLTPEEMVARILRDKQMASDY